MRKYSLLTIALLAIPLRCSATDACGVCLDTPPETKELHTGKGGSVDGLDHVEKPAKPIFSGNLFYKLDEGEKQILPKGRGVFVRIQDRKKHKIEILGEFGENWGAVRFDCNEYKYGTKISFASGGTYGPGWKTFPLPKNEKKCRWHPGYR